VPSQYDDSAAPYSEEGSQFIDTRYANIHRVGNTNRGYSYSITARLRKTFEGVVTENSALRTDERRRLLGERRAVGPAVLLRDRQ
jgi:hypothetical protein